MGTAPGVALFLIILMWIAIGRRPIRTTFVSMVMLALMPLPIFVSPGISFPQVGTLFWADVLAVVLIAKSIGYVASAQPRGLWGPVVVFLVVLLLSTVGLFNGAAVGYIARDLRGVIRLIAAYAGAQALVLALGWNRFVQLLVSMGSALSLWTAGAVASVIAMGAASPFEIRAESSGLYINGEAAFYDALRVAPISGLACALFAALGTAAFLRRGASWSAPARCTTLGIFAAWFVLFAGYTRGHFVLAIVVLAGSVFFIPRAGAWKIGPLQFWIIPSFCILGLALVLVDARVGSFVREAVQAFSGRVIQGLAPEVFSADSSIAWRAREGAAAWESFSYRPLLGTGFGAPYRSFLENEIFTGADGLTYVHNTYLWLLVKGGAMLAVLVVAFLIRQLMHLVGARRRVGSRLVLMFATIMIALAGLSLGTPVAFESSNSVLVGIMLGMVKSLSAQVDMGGWLLEAGSAPGQTDAPSTRNL